MDEVSLVQLCLSAFSAEDIQNAKNLLFESVPTQLRKVTRKKDGKSERNLYDVISLFKQTDPELVPIFVARELWKLPAVTLDHIDVSRTLKELQLLQIEIKNIKEAYVTKEELLEVKNELTNLKQMSLVNNFDMNVNCKRGGGGGIIDSFCLDSGPMGLQNVVQDNIQPSTSTSTTHLPHITITRTPKSRGPSVHSSANKKTAVLSHKKCNKPVIFEKTCQPIERSANAATEIAVDEVCVAAASVSEPEQQHGNNPQIDMWSKPKTLEGVVNIDGEWKRESPSQEWRMVQRKRLRNRLTGTRGSAQPDVNFKAAEITVPLFINNVDKATNELDIINYIRQKTSVSVQLKKINMKKQKRYDAYKIFVPHNKLSLFLDDCLWPEGIQFRKFIYFNRNNYDKNNENRISNNDMNMNNL